MASPLFSPLLIKNGIGNYIENNRISMHHLGLEGILLSNLKWKGFLTISHNIGSFTFPYEKPKNQFASLLSFEYIDAKFPIDLSLSLAADIGQLYENQFGAMIKISKSW
jgi:hypothetical protein